MYTHMTVYIYIYILVYLFGYLRRTVTPMVLINGIEKQRMNYHPMVKHWQQRNNFQNTCFMGSIVLKLAQGTWTSWFSQVQQATSLLRRLCSQPSSGELYTNLSATMHGELHNVYVPPPSILFSLALSLVKDWLVLGKPTSEQWYLWRNPNWWMHWRLTGMYQRQWDALHPWAHLGLTLTMRRGTSTGG